MTLALRPLLATITVICIVAGLGGALTDIGPWYLALKQPAWKPPDWLFGPIWSTIYVFTAWSALTAWRTGNPKQRRLMLALFALNALLNLLWSLLFFWFRRPDWALLEVGLLWISIVLLMLALSRHSRKASLLLLPYLLWVGVAAVLNAATVRLNGPF